MVLVGTEKAAAWLRDQIKAGNFKDFEVRRDIKDCNTLVSKSVPSDDLDTKINAFVRDMQGVTGRAWLMCYDEDSQTKKKFSIEFDLTDYGANGQPSVAALTQNQQGDMISRETVEIMLQKERMQNKIDLMQHDLEQLKEANRRLESPSREFFNKIAPIAPALVQGLVNRFAPAPAVAQVGVIDTVTPTQQAAQADSTEESNLPELDIPDDEFARLSAYLAKWKQYDADFVAVIGKVADLAGDNPSMYNQAKSMLTNM
jgi:hypothetical protein